MHEFEFTSVVRSCIFTNLVLSPFSSFLSHFSLDNFFDTSRYELHYNVLQFVYR